MVSIDRENVLWRDTFFCRFSEYRRDGVGLAFFVNALLVSALACAEDVPVLKEITVSSQRSDVAERRESNTQKIVFDRKEIENLGVMTIGEVLGKLPGVEAGAARSDGSATQRARGMSRDSVQILVDGERPAGGSRMVTGVIGRLPSGDLERVEILRGSSAEFGGAAPLTINLVMKKALSKRSTSLKAALGFRGSKPNAQFNWTENGGEGGFGWSLPVTLNMTRSPSHVESDRQDTTAGVRSLWQKESENGLHTFRELAIAPRMIWRNGPDSLSVSPVFWDGVGKRNSDMAQTAYADPVAVTGLAFNGDRSSREDNHRRMLRLRVEGEKRLGESKFSGRAALNRGRRTVDVTRNAHDALNTSTISTENTSSKENEDNLALRLDHPLGEHLLALGLEHINLRRTEDQNFGGSFVSVSSHIASEQQNIAWLQDDWTPQRSLTLTMGVRGENLSLSSDGAAQQQHRRLLPSVAVRWEPADKWVARSSLGAGMKMPTLDEISNTVTRSIAANTPVEADRRGNQNLLPERSVNFEAVLERYLDQDAGVLGANLYVRSTESFIERRVQLEGARWVDRPYNEGRALHWGVEVDGKVRTDSFGWKGATVKAHLTLPHAQVNDSRLGIQRMARDTPRYIFSAGLEESLPKLQSSYGVSLQLSGRSETDIPGEQYALAKAKTTLDAFWLRKLTPQFNLRVSGQNLLATDTVRESLFTAAGNSWRLGKVDSGFRVLLVTLEGRF
jgi:iron complex outermembrane receptor protein